MTAAGVPLEPEMGEPDAPAPLWPVAPTRRRARLAVQQAEVWGVWKELQPALFRQALAICGNRTTAEEVVLDALERSIRPYVRGSVRNLPGYLRQTVHNLAINVSRKTENDRRKELLAAHLMCCQEDTDAWIEREDVRQGLARLPTNCQELLRRKYWDGLSNEQIAKETHWSRSTVTARCRECREKLRRTIEAN